MSRLIFWGLNRIGDAVYTLPLLDALAERFDVIVFTRTFLAPIYMGREIRVELVESVREGWHALRRLHPDGVLLMYNAAKYALVSWAADVPRRIGYNKEFRKPFLTDWLPYPDRLIHRLEYNARLGDLLGVDSRGRLPKIHVLSEAVKATLTRFALLKQKYVVFIVGSIALSRRLPPEKFARMAEKVVDAGYVPVIVGGKADQVLAQEVMERSRVSVMDLTGQTSLAETQALFKGAAGVIANDTGPMHLAGAIGVPVVTWFGPANMEEIAPPFTNVDIYLPPLDCLGCLKERCPLGHNRCLTLVDENERAKRLLNMLTV